LPGLGPRAIWLGEMVVVFMRRPFQWRQE